MLKTPTILLLMVLTAVLVTGCGGEETKSQSESASAESTSGSAEPFDSLVIVLQGREGLSVFSLLSETHKVDYIESAMGNFVNAVDSIEISKDFGWLYSVNGEMGTVASDKFITSDSDVVRWHYRKF